MREGRVELRALRRINAGEVLGVNYMDEAFLLQPGSVRREILFRERKFRCLCPRCEPSSRASRSPGPAETSSPPVMATTSSASGAGLRAPGDGRCEVTKSGSRPCVVEEQNFFREAFDFLGCLRAHLEAGHVAESLAALRPFERSASESLDAAGRPKLQALAKQLQERFISMGFISAPDSSTAAGSPQADEAFDSFWCRYAVVRELPMRCFICRREGAAHLEELVGERAPIPSTVHGLSTWLKEYSFVVELCGTLCILERISLKEWQQVLAEQQQGRTGSLPHVRPRGSTCAGPVDLGGTLESVETQDR
eukprot:g25822.t1